MALRKGQWVKVGGKIAIVVVVGPGEWKTMEAKVVASAPAGKCLVQFVDADGNDLTVPNAELQKFVPAMGLLENKDIVAITERGDIPAKRLATMDPNWVPKA